MYRIYTLFCALVISFSYSQNSSAQPPYTLSLEDWMRIQQHMMRHFNYGRPYQEPYVFRLASVDQQFIPVKKNILESLYSQKEVRQSFATEMPDGSIESVAVYLKQAPLSNADSTGRRNILISRDREKRSVADEIQNSDLLLGKSEGPDVGPLAERGLSPHNRTAV